MNFIAPIPKGGLFQALQKEIESNRRRIECSRRKILRHALTTPPEEVVAAIKAHLKKSLQEETDADECFAYSFVMLKALKDRVSLPDWMFLFIQSDIEFTHFHIGSQRLADFFCDPTVLRMFQIAGRQEQLKSIEVAILEAEKRRRSFDKAHASLPGSAEYALLITMLEQLPLVTENRKETQARDAMRDRLQSAVRCPDTNNVRHDFQALCRVFKC